MSKDDKREVGTLVFWFAIVLCVVALANLPAQESGLVDAPIISDQEVRTDSVRIVGKDEAQRVSDDTVLRIQRLENRVADLENEIIQHDSRLKALE